MTAPARLLWEASKPGRARSTNHREHHMVRARLTREEREEWGWLWREAQGRGLVRGATRPVEVTVTLYGSGTLQDPGNCYPSVKAAVDAATDVGIIAGDTGRHVARIILEAPVRVPKVHTRMTVTIREVP